MFQVWSVGGSVDDAAVADCASATAVAADAAVGGSCISPGTLNVSNKFATKYEFIHSHRQNTSYN